MAKVPDMVPVTDLRQGAAELLERVRKSSGPIVITQRGRAAAVLVSVATYERADAERQILLALANGEREIKAGHGFSLDEVLADADVILSKPKR